MEDRCLVFSCNQDQMQTKNGRQKASEAPCSTESKISMKCLDKHNYEKEKCQQEFEAYKECKKLETQTRAQRREEALRSKR